LNPFELEFSKQKEKSEKKKPYLHWAEMHSAGPASPSSYSPAWADSLSLRAAQRASQPHRCRLLRRDKSRQRESRALELAGVRLLLSSLPFSLPLYQVTAPAQPEQQRRNSPSYRGEICYGSARHLLRRGRTAPRSHQLVAEVTRAPARRPNLREANQMATIQRRIPNRLSQRHLPPSAEAPTSPTTLSTGTDPSRL